MQHDDRVYLRHMAEVAAKAGAMAGADRARFDGDEVLQLALIHLIQMLGEAAGRVSDATRTRYPSIPWREIIGMRHRVVHDYMAVELDIVWQVVSADLPLLVPRLELAAREGGLTRE